MTKLRFVLNFAILRNENETGDLNSRADHGIIEIVS